MALNTKVIDALDLLGSDLNDRKYTSGTCAYLGPNLISWSSKKQRVIFRLINEVEYRRLASLVTNLF